MSFTVNLLFTSADPRQVNKPYSVIAGAVNIIPTSAFDIIAPTLYLDYKENYLSANYCYIPMLKRYYYINDISIDIGKRIALNCKIDVLMSYSSEIRQCQACVVRSESVGKPTYVQDSQLPIHPSDQEIKSIRFSEEPFIPTLLSSHYIITTIGGGFSGNK